ncbi:hypothetical protein PVK06_017446 [Gossypium arboreum]|uniref:DUF4283 domain-containing protein n=1 Tax=Gossypium arboreum TaxID=29729 RepID=A0ABR0Q349_GOSAR|nr:hypothetical protein PVK06_017446 [Gossypium arboreum]
MNSDEPSNAIISNERSGDLIPTELLKAAKKVKNKDTTLANSDDLVMLEPEPNKPSFKEILLENSSTSPRVDVRMPLNEEEEVTLLDDDVSISMDGPYPQVCFSKRVHSLINEHNKKTVIVRMLGKPIRYRALANKIESLWGLTSNYKIVNLDNNYFLVKLGSQNDYNRVIMGGLWMVYGHYLVVQPWSRDFSTEQNFPSKIIAWIRLSGLYYRYYTKGLVRALASVNGNVVKVDYNTIDGTRGKFARVTVGEDISKPLMPFIGVEGKKQTVVYEGLSSICYTCGMVGHIKENYSQGPNE